MDKDRGNFQKQKKRFTWQISTEGGKLQDGRVCQTQSPGTSRGLHLLSQQQEGQGCEEEIQEGLAKEVSRESQGRRDSTYSRRNTETQRKTLISRESSGYSRGRTRGQEVSVSEELPKDQPEDTDQELEVTFNTQESRKSE